MKTTYQLPAKKIKTVGVFSTRSGQGDDTTTTGTTDTTSLLTLSTTHVFNR